MTSHHIDLTRDSIDCVVETHHVAVRANQRSQYFQASYSGSPHEFVVRIDAANLPIGQMTLALTCVKSIENVSVSYCY